MDIHGCGPRMGREHAFKGGPDFMGCRAFDNIGKDIFGERGDEST